MLRKTAFEDLRAAPSEISPNTVCECAEEIDKFGCSSQVLQKKRFSVKLHYMAVPNVGGTKPLLKLLESRC